MFTYGREKERIGAKNIACLAVSMIMCLLAMLIYIYPSIRATSLMYEYSTLLGELEELKELNKKMKLEVSTLRSYDFTEKRAMNDLGYVLPAPGQVVIIAKK